MLDIMMNKLLVAFCCCFMTKNNRKNFRDKYRNSSDVSFEYRRSFFEWFFWSKDTRRKIDKLWEVERLENMENKIDIIFMELLPLNIKQTYFLNDTRTSIEPLIRSNFAVYFSGGLTDQLYYLLDAIYFYNKCKRKVVFFGNTLNHGGFVMDKYYIENFIEYEIISKEKSDEIVNLYNNYGLYLSGYRLPITISDLSFPLLYHNLRGEYFKDNNSHYSNDNVDINKLLTLKIPLPPLVEQKLQQIKNTKHSVCVHVRGGDVLFPPHLYLLNVSYFKSSILSMLSKLNTTEPVTFFVFSNSPELVKKRFNEFLDEIINLNNSNNKNITFDFVNINKDEEPHFELELMRNCKHFIVSCGGFSNLARRLGQYESKIYILPEESDRCKNQDEKEREWKYKIKNNDILIL